MTIIFTLYYFILIGNDEKFVARKWKLKHQVELETR